MPRPFRMWLYPLPALVATAGFLYVLLYRPDFQKELRYAALILVAGIVIYFLRGRLDPGVEARPKPAVQS
jgi:hypothetical protein